MYDHQRAIISNDIYIDGENMAEKYHDVIPSVNNKQGRMNYMLQHNLLYNKLN